MGSFLTNVQVKVAGPSASGLSRVAEVVTAIVSRAGFTPVAAESDRADRSIAIVAHEGRSWIGVYDEASEDQSGSHEQLAEKLSRELGVQTVATLVHDSDVLNLRLFDTGRALDSFSNWPGYFEGGEQQAKGNANAWSRLGPTPAQLQQVWDDGERAEEMLFALAELFAMDPRLALVGFNYLEDAPTEAREQKILLRLRAGTRPAHEAKRTDAPRFQSGMWATPDAATVAELFRALGREPPPARVFRPRSGSRSFDVPVVGRNDGGPTRGVHVLVMGPALDEQRIRVVGAKICTQGREHEAPAVPAELASGRAGVSFEFPEVDIAAGLVNPHAALQNASSVQQVQERTPHVYTVNLRCEVVAPSGDTSALVVVVAPSEAPDNGAAERFLVGS